VLWEPGGVASRATPRELITATVGAAHCSTTP
jgi:hypothetical protein